MHNGVDMTNKSQKKINNNNNAEFNSFYSTDIKKKKFKLEIFPVTTVEYYYVHQRLEKNPRFMLGIY